jgi:hypothetical protein
MSAATLVLLALLVALALIGPLIKALRRKAGRPAGPTATGLPRRAPAPTPSPEPTASPLRDPHDLAALDAIPAGAADPASDASRPASLTRHPDRPLEPPTGVVLPAGGGLQRAIVLIAVLGPCRARSPYGSASDESTRAGG